MRRIELREAGKKVEEAQRFKLGNKAFENKEYLLAEQMYEKALQHDSSDAKIWNNRAIARMELAKYEQALADAQMAIQLDATYQNGYLRAVEALIFLRRLEDAQLFLGKAEQLKGNSRQVSSLKQKIRIIMENRHKHQIEMMLGWLRVNGGHFPKIGIEFQSVNSRSIVCKQKINRKELVLFIPKNQMITLELAYESKTVRLVDSRRSQLLSPKHCLLSIYLLQQKHNPSSFFKYYIDVLPKQHTHFPIYYTQEQMHQLKGSHFYEQIQQKRVEIRKDYNTIQEIDPSFRFSYEEFCWARMTVCSRVFGINIQEKKTDALVPLADMLNHRVPRQTTWCYCDDREGFVIESMESVEPGSEIFDSYGKKCNSRFLLNYGFILDNNDSNQVTLKIQLSETDPLLTTKLQILGDDTTTYTYRLLKNVQDKTFDQFLSALRFISIKSQQDMLFLRQWQIINNQRNFRITQTPFIMYEHEARTWVLFKSILEKRINSYQTTISEDRKILENQGLSVNIRNCVLLRKGEKEILQFYLRMCQRMIKLFDSKQKVRNDGMFQDFRKTTQKAQYKEYSSYLKKIVQELDQVP